MPLPPEHRDAIQVLARRWRQFAAERTLHDRASFCATVAVIGSGAGLLVLPKPLWHAAWLVIVLTGLFLWGGWFKLYHARDVRRHISAGESELGERLAALCGSDAAFSGPEAGIDIDGRIHDPFSEKDYG